MVGVVCGAKVLELAGEVEADFGEVLLRHLEHVARVGEKHVASLSVDGHVLLLATFEGVECLFVVALNPACVVQAKGLPATLGAIFVEQAVLNHLKLQLPHGADDFAVIELVDE